jgi:predicted branched-subunit amino acid permease
MQAPANDDVFEQQRNRRAQFVEGFVAMLPLWSGAIPAGIAYGVAATSAGIGDLEAQLMSLLVFTAAGQLTAVSLIDAGSSLVATLITVTVVNAQLPLLGIVVARQLKPTNLERAQLSLLLTDAAFGIAASREPLRHYVLVGAGLSMYLGWNIGTAIGLTTGKALGDPAEIGLDFVVPLAFLAVLVPLVRNRPAIATVVTAALVALVMLQVAPLGVAILVAGAAGSAVGVALSSAEGPAGGKP